MLEPTISVTAARVMMRPVNNTALLTPLIFTIKFHFITYIQIVNARCEVDIMRYQNGLAGT
jgi:hypothetical protein